MARRSKSRRGRGRKRKGGKGMMILASAVLVACGAGGWFVFGPDDGTKSAQASINDLIGETEDAGDEGDSDSEEGDSRPSGTSLAKVESMMAEVNTALIEADSDKRNELLRTHHGKLSKLLEGPLPVEERRRVIGVFHSITDELFLSEVQNEFSENYVVQRNDNYDKIARKFNIGINLLYDLNGRERGSSMLRIHETLKVPKGEPRVVVRKSDYTTSVYFGDHLVRQYIVAHGRDDNTPVGSSIVDSKTIDPERSAYGPNDPRSEMKLRWVGLKDYAKGRTGIGFHGTQFPDSIPGQTSRGCIRMHDEAILELYDFVREGRTKVEVRS